VHFVQAWELLVTIGPINGQLGLLSQTGNQGFPVPVVLHCAVPLVEQRNRFIAKKQHLSVILKVGQAELLSFDDPFGAIALHE
jgi:hypothetical protein